MRIVNRLSDEQRYQVYKYVIENRCVAQNGENYEFRVQNTIIAREINILGFLGVPIQPPTVKDCVEKVIFWQRTLNKLPVVPKETVEMDKLSIRNTQLTRQVEELKLQVSTLQSQLTNRNNNAEDILKRIRAIVKEV